MRYAVLLGVLLANGSAWLLGCNTIFGIEAGHRGGALVHARLSRGPRIVCRGDAARRVDSGATARGDAHAGRVLRPGGILMIAAKWGDLALGIDIHAVTLPPPAPPGPVPLPHPFIGVVFDPLGAALGAAMGAVCGGGGLVLINGMPCENAGTEMTRGSRPCIFVPSLHPPAKFPLSPPPPDARPRRGQHERPRRAGRLPSDVTIACRRPGRSDRRHRGPGQRDLPRVRRRESGTRAPALPRGLRVPPGHSGEVPHVGHGPNGTRTRGSTRRDRGCGAGRHAGELGRVAPRSSAADVSPREGERRLARPLPLPRGPVRRSCRCARCGARASRLLTGSGR